MENALIGGAIVRKINHSIFTRLPLEPFHSNTVCARPPTHSSSRDSDLEPIKVKSRYLLLPIKWQFKWRSLFRRIAPPCGWSSIYSYVESAKRVCLLYSANSDLYLNGMVTYAMVPYSINRPFAGNN